MRRASRSRSEISTPLSAGRTVPETMWSKAVRWRATQAASSRQARCFFRASDCRTTAWEPCSSRAATRRSVSLTQSDRGISLLQESSATPRVAAGRAGAAAGRSARAMTPNQRTESIIPPTARVKTSRLSTALVFENEKGAGRAGAPVVGVATRSVARRQLAVELALRRALLELLVGALELLVDHALEVLEGLRTGEEATVDEEGRGAASAHPVGVGGVAVDVVAVLA